MPAAIPPGYPARLLCNGRPLDPKFSPTERLYFRLPPLQEDDESVDFVSPDKVPPLPVSVNREKYSQPLDVIFGYPNYGIAVLRVQEVPDHLVIPDTGIKLEFRVEHDPVDNEYMNNYAHTEIRIYRDQTKLAKEDLDRKERLAVREMISRRAKVFKHPNRKA